MRLTLEGDQQALVFSDCDISSGYVFCYTLLTNISTGSRYSWGDFNAMHTGWGYHRSDAWGKHLWQDSVNDKLIIANELTFLTTSTSNTDISGDANAC